MTTISANTQELLYERLSAHSAELSDLRARVVATEKSRVPAAAIWTIALTIFFGAVSIVWIAGQTYREVSNLRETVDDWKPKIDKITEMMALQQEVNRLRDQVEGLYQHPPTASTEKSH